MTIYYSATTNAFYDSQVYNVNNIPEDKVAVAESTYKNLMAQQCAGRVIVAAADGTPTTIAQTCGPCTSTKYATKTELTNGLAAKANDSNVVHKTGDETINGVKSFGGMLKATNGTVQVGADTGYSVTFNYNGNITSKQARGTYNIFFPEGNGTLALTSDINGKANDSDVVHKTGNETIKGNKTFTNQLYLGAGGGSYGLISAKDNNSILRLLGGTSAGTGANLDLYGENLSDGGFSLRARTSDKIVGLDGKVDGTLKWNGKNVALDENLVHKSGNETIAGTKTFTDKVHCYSLKHPTDNSYFYISGGSDWNKGANLFLYGISLTGGNAGSFELVARNTTQTRILTGYPNGTLTWGGKSLAIDENLVHRSGNEDIAGAKTFLNDIYFKNNNIDLTVTPSSNTYSNFIFRDKNNKTLSYLQYGKQTSGNGVVGLYLNDSNQGLHGLQVTSNNYVIPLTNNAYSLGASDKKWANVYSDEINTKYFTYTHDGVISYSYLPKASGTLAIQERTRASAVVENRTLLYECAGGLDLGDITLNDVYSKFNALLIVYSNDDGGGISTYYLDCAELDIRREVAGSGTFLLVDGHSYWACTGASTGFKFVHSKNNGLRIHKIYGLAKYY